MNGACGFSRSSNTYDIVSDFHREVARRTLGLVGEVAAERVLELGAGTGHLTELISRSCPDSEIIATDKSSQMLGVLGRKFGRRRRIETSVLDFEGDYSQLGGKFP